MQPHTALGVYGPTVYVIVGRTVCHAMDGPSHAFANPVNVDIRGDFPRVFLSEWIGEVWSHDGVAGRHGKNHLPLQKGQSGFGSEGNCTSSMGTSGKASGPSAL